MKKFLLILMAAIFTLAANAQKARFNETMPIRKAVKFDKSKAVAGNHSKLLQLAKSKNTVTKAAINTRKKVQTRAEEEEGTWKFYAMSVYMLDESGEFYGEQGVATGIYETEESILVYGLFPMFDYNYGELALEAEYDRRGNLVINCDDIYGYLYNYEVHVASFTEDDMDEEGNILNWRDIEFVEDENQEGVLTLADPDSYIAVLAISRGEVAGWFDIEAGIALTDVTDMLPEMAYVPETAEEHEMMHTFTYSNSEEQFVGYVYVDGDDYYFDGLALASGGVVKGTRNGNTITVPSNQYTGMGSGYFSIFYALTVTNGAGNVENDVKFTVNEDGSMTAEKGVLLAEYTLAGDMLIYVEDMELTPYAGDVLVKPAAATKAACEYIEDEDMILVSFLASGKGEAGEYINPARLFYQLIIDGDEEEPFQFSEKYVEDEQLIGYQAVPWMYNGYNAGYSQNGTRFIWLFTDTKFKTLGVRLVYALGEPGEEELAISDVTPVQIADGINSVLAPAEKPVSFYDLQGRRMDNLKKGIVVSNGKKFLVK